MAMETITSFYYANIDVTVNILKEHTLPNVLDDLTPNQRLALSNHIYTAINSFVFTRALYAADKQIENGG